MTDGRRLAFLNKIQALHCDGFIVRVPQHLWMCGADMQLEEAGRWVRLTTACLLRRAWPTHIQARWTGLGRLGLR